MNSMTLEGTLPLSFLVSYCQ